jgi:teichoic acid transport system permease protein
MKTIAEIWKEHFVWRRQILKLAKSDIVKTYSGAAFGWAWALIKPLVMILVFWFAFGVGLRAAKDVDGYPFILWLIAGMVPWFFMSEMITQGASCLRKYSYLVTKMRFPVSTIPTFVGLSKLTVHLCLLVISIIIFACFGRFPDIYMLQLPFYMLMMLLFFIIWGQFASMLSAISKDFQNLIEAFVTAFFWLSGIMWDINEISNPIVRTILYFNPVTFVATGYRNVFIYKVWFWEQGFALLAFGIVLVIMILLAQWSYRKLRKEIPDVLM